MQKSLEQAIVKGVVKGLTKSSSRSSLAPSSVAGSFRTGKEALLKLPSLFKQEDDLNDDEMETAETPSAPIGQQLARFILSIYDAEGVPCGQLLTRPGKGKEELISVQVAFGVHSAKTKPQDSDLRMSWNEQFTFIEAFPPQSSSMWIEICSGESTTFSYPKVIGTYVLDLSKISDDGDKGFLPTFGPAYVNLYGTKSGAGTLKRKEDSVFMDSFERAAYKGRLCVALEVELLRESVVLPMGVQVTPCKSILKDAEEKADFLLFGCIMDVSLLSKKLQNKTVYLEINIGHGGDTGTTSGIYEKLMENNFSGGGFFNHPYKMNSTTPMLNAEIRGPNYCSIPFGDKKPCIFIHTKHGDFRWRMFHSNFLQKLSKFLDDGLSNVLNLLDYSKERAAESFDRLLHDLMKEARECLKYVETRPPHSHSTHLDFEIWRTTYDQLNIIINDGMQWEIKGEIHKIEENVQMLQGWLNKLQKLADNPQDCLPDVFVWLKIGEKRLAYIRIPARDLLFSEMEREMGSLWSKLTCFHFQKHARHSNDESFSKIQGQLLASFWFGLSAKRQRLLSGLPVGYQLTKEVVSIEEQHSSLPSSLFFTEKQVFQLRCHLYQGKCLLPLDATGFSDPFCRIMFQGQSISSKSISQTLNPLWDETLVIPYLTLYGTAEYIKSNPPQVFAEILDEDLFGKDEEFMGQIIAQPHVKLENEPYCVPKLQWYPVSRGSEHGGEVLAAFELLQIFHDGGLPNDIAKLEPDTDCDSEKPVIRIPDAIRPILSTYRFEVLFWCLRDLQKVYLQAVEKPRVDIECGKITISSELLKNYAKNPMFHETIKIANVELPDDPKYWPAVTIRCMDSRSFGRATVVGSAVINKLHSFVVNSPADSKETYDNVPLHSEIEMADAAIRLWKDPLRTAGTHVVGSFLKDSASYKGDYLPLDTFEDRVDSLFLNMGVDEEENMERNMKMKMDWWSKYYASQSMPGEDVIDMKLTNNNEANLKQQSFVRKVKNTLRKTKTLHDKQKGFHEPPPFPVEKLEIFPAEIEKMKEFHGYQDWVKTYDLHRGHRTTGTADEKTKIGVFKGIVKICKYPLPLNCTNGLFKSVPSNDPVRVIVRVYVIRAYDLTATDYGHKADPYLRLQLASTVIDDEENYIPNSLNPIFGKCFEFSAVFPLESQLTIQVYDKDVMSRNDFIGETVIDLENRFYSSHRGTCGLASAYEDEGYNKWRDSLKPTEILGRYCTQLDLSEPRYFSDRVIIGRKAFMLPPSKFKIFQDTQAREEAALHVLHRWNEMPEIGANLMPEHIETRTLYNPSKPGPHGRLEMWVDMFTMDSAEPAPPVNIVERKPNQYELRVIIWNTDDVTLQEQNYFTKEWMSDIFVRGWLKDSNIDAQNTDVHYRSTTGEGNFNWRFIFKFDYIEAEQKIVFKKKQSVVALDETEKRTPPILHLEVWDIDIVASNDFLGSVSLNLNKLPRGAQSAKKCKLKLVDPAYHRGAIDLFKQKRIKAWWPVTTRNESSGELELTGKVEAELHLMTQDEADLNPVGRGSSGPEELPKPKRPDTSFLGIISPLKTFRYFCYYYRIGIVKYLCLIILICFVFEFIFAIPTYLVKYAFNSLTSSSSSSDDSSENDDD